jgi:primosomal protein N' (replication factor Y)
VSRYIRVALDVPLPTLFDYAWPHASPSHIGFRIRVPFGRRQAIGVIMEVADAPAVDQAKVRAAGELLDEGPALPGDLIALLRFVSAYYHHPIGEVVMAALPPRHRAGATRREPAAIALTDSGRSALQAGMRRSPLAQALLESLARAAEPSRLVRELEPPMRRIVRRLIDRGWLNWSEPCDPRDPEHVPVRTPALTPEQQEAIAALERAGPGFSTWLLHGITGSGKTEVYLAAMARVLAADRQVLFLVPEIGLTPQLEASLRLRFPAHRLVTLHSAMAATRRAEHWSAAQHGRARIVLGTRSAIFAPLPQLGLIVVDEEHDASYKQQEGVRYSARDLAVWRARDRGVPVILGSATPSLETYHQASNGRYALARLTQRPKAAPLPRVELIADSGPKLEGGIAPAMLAAIRSRIAQGSQVLVFINRRGYAPVLLCPACAWAPTCPRCAVHTVLHKARARMACHHCGHEAPVPVRCDQCGNADLKPVGFGTQRIEAALRTALPSARLQRIDRDTTRAREAWPQMRDAILRRELDLLVGTQLLSKGHDFAGISLVCVLNADRSLFSTDFRASERLFAQLQQVSGRAGRGTIAGEVLIQTAFPAHPLYAAVRAHDYEGFARLLLDERRQAGLPPFVHQALLRAEAPRLQDALDFLHRAAELARPSAASVTIYDPAPAAMTRLQGRERAQLLVQCEARPALHRFLDGWCAALWGQRASRARWTLDVDPLDI